jgi:hypothetical protein
MKIIITTLLLTFMTTICVGQVYSVTIDSLTKSNIDKLTDKQKLKFDSILTYRKSVDFFTRLDTTTFDIAFIQETFCFADTLGNVTERYFMMYDTIPKYVYRNGKHTDPKDIYDGFLIWYSKNVTYYTTLYPLIDNYSKLKPTQELNYDKRQIWSHGCVIYKDSKKIFEKKRTEQLKTTYQIQTMIDKKDHKIIVSVQYAPRRPKFKTHSYNAVWDW